MSKQRTRINSFLIIPFFLADTLHLVLFQLIRRLNDSLDCISQTLGFLVIISFDQTSLVSDRPPGGQTVATEGLHVTRPQADPAALAVLALEPVTAGHGGPPQHSGRGEQVILEVG